jgi:hypothetical protein
VNGEHVLLTGLDDLAEQAVALAFDEPRRAAMAADPAWADYLAEVGRRGILIKMENRIVKPAPFFAALKR